MIGVTCNRCGQYIGARKTVAEAEAMNLEHIKACEVVK